MSAPHWTELFAYTQDYSDQFKSKVDTIAQEKGDQITHEDISHLDLIHPSRHEGIDKFTDSFPIAQGSKIIQIGSALGGTARHIVGNKNLSLYGIDYLENLVQAANYSNRVLKMDHKIQFEQADITQADLGENLYDVGFTIGVFMYIPEDHSFQIVAKALKPGALFYFQDYYFHFPQSEFNEDENKCYFARKMYGVRTKEHLLRVLDQAGFDLVEEDDWGPVWSTAAWERSENLLKGHKEGSIVLNQDHYFQYIEISPYISCQLNEMTVEEIREKFPVLTQEIDPQEVVFEKRQFAGAIRLVLRKRG